MANRGARIHVVVLTRDRPETLQRCVSNISSSLASEDVLTILDDSVVDSSARQILSDQKTGIEAPIRFYVPFREASQAIGKSASAPNPVWLSKSAPRDIAPLRNLSLLLSSIIRAQTTILIDDDIHSCDLISTHNRVRTFSRTTQSVIVGAEICGISELDLITRLTDAIATLKNLFRTSENNSFRELFYVRDSLITSNRDEVRHVSGGYLAFQIPSDRLFAFPPGYNEDWIWCLLHRKSSQVQIARLDTVVHDPPLIRKPTREDVFFELIGDLLFDCLDEQYDDDVCPEVALENVTKWRPSLESMPSKRASDLLTEMQHFVEESGSPFVLQDYGFGVLADMLHAGELEIDERQILKEWSRDAIMKHRSFSASLRDDDTLSSVAKLLRRGKI